MSYLQMLDQEWLSDHKQQIAIDTICVAALSCVLIMEGRSSGLTIYAKCGVDPFAQCF